jgi:hypothetical protein
MIVNRALVAAFQAREVALEVRENRLALKCYDNVVSKHVQDALEQLPSSWKPAASTLRFNVGGKRVALRLDDGVGTKPVPYRFWNSSSHSDIGVVGGVPLLAEVETYLQDVETLKADREAAKVKLRALLDSVQTVAKLDELWPEGKAFIDGVVPETRNLPAVRVEDVNTALGLPLPDQTKWMGA